MNRRSVQTLIAIATGSTVGCAAVLGIGDLPSPSAIDDAASTDATADSNPATDATDALEELDTGGGFDQAVSETGNPFPGCGGDPNCRVVFVTKATFNAGTFGNLGGADTKCTEARNAGLPALTGHAFKAWVSDATTDARDHVALVDNKRFVRIDGTVVADDKTDLLNGSLKNAIDRDESGGKQTGETWTGSNADGTRTTEVCAGWTNPDGMGTAGNLTAVNATWSLVNFGTVCKIERRLYCFQTD